MGCPPGVREGIDVVSVAIEILAIVIIGIAVGTANFWRGSVAKPPDSGAYEQYIIRTVALDATLEAIAALGLLVIVRTFLSWALVVEMEGRWPWQPRTGAEPNPRAVRVAEDSLRRRPG